MYQPKENDYVLITNSNSSDYLQIGKIVDTVKCEHDDYINTYVVEFYDKILRISYRMAYKGTMFEDGEAKVLEFKR